MFTPNPMPTAQITTQSEPPQTEEIIMAISSTGKAIRMSTSTATVSRSQRVVSAPSAARAMPTTVATMPAPTLTNTVVRAPAISRLRMSRPVSSVPRRCGQLGGSQRSPMSEACGSNGVHNSDTRAVTAITATTMIPKRLSRRPRVGRASAESCGLPLPRVDRAVQEIDQEAHDQHEAG